MIIILPPEQVWEILGAYECRECLRCLKNHNQKERQTCHDHALASVTLLRRAMVHNPHRRNDEQSGRCQT